MTSKITGRLFKLAQSAGTKLGWTIKGQHVGYGSDANHLSSKNIDLLVGLGPYGQGMHTDEEFLDPKSYGRQKELSLGIIKAYLTRPWALVEVLTRHSPNNTVVFLEDKILSD